MTKNCEQLDIDTKEICLLCLGSRVATNCFDSPSTLPSLQGLKHLLRYLKVSPKLLFNCSSEFLQSMEIREDIDVKISLCSGCSSVTEKFNKLYQEYELIQFQFGNCIQTLHESMSKGNENPERVRKYKEQMRPTKSADLVNSSIAANFRNETLKKCSLKLKSETPRVRVQKPNLEICLLPKPKPGGVEVGVEVISDGKTQVQEHSVTAPVLPESQEDCLNLDAPMKSLQMSSEPIPADIEVIARAKLVKPNTTRKPGYFNSIRNKLKSNSQPTATISVAQRLGGTTPKICEYCKRRYSSQLSLRSHLTVEHSEHIISKYLPCNVPAELCKQEVDVVWEQMCKSYGSQCQFCKFTSNFKRNLKRHWISCHASKVAMKVFENMPKSPRNHSNTNTNTRKFSEKIRLPCEFCDSTFTTKLTLRCHKYYMHPEHILYKFFPPYIPLDSCKQGVDAVLKQLWKQSSSGKNCKFCTLHSDSANRAAFKLHVVSKHGEQVALEAQRCIGVSPSHLDVASSDDLLSGSSLINYDHENSNSQIENINSNDSHQSPTPVDWMDFEIGQEGLMKIENPPPGDVESDPLCADDFD